MNQADQCNSDVYGTAGCSVICSYTQTANAVIKIAIKGAFCIATP